MSIVFIFTVSVWKRFMDFVTDSVISVIYHQEKGETREFLCQVRHISF